MPQDQALRRALVKTLLMALLALLGVPLLSFGFVRHVQHGMDARMQASIERHMDEEHLTDAAERATVLKNYAAVYPSVVCSNTDPDAQEMRNDLCEFNGQIWHFHWARIVSLLALGVGVLTLLVVPGLGAMAFRGRAAQYTSLALGWRYLQAASAAVVVLQGVLCVWLSFWLTAHFFNSYVVKLIVVVAIFAATGVFMVLRKIFERVDDENKVDGELLTPEDAPALFDHVRAMARHMKTEPPQQIVAGIDANFFVTESPLTAGEATWRGRSLFVSIPLLRQLTHEQASAVLSHELAHFSGGDTAAGARLGPLLNRYDHYLHAMYEGGLTMLVYPAMHLFRLVQQLALSRESRQREFRADRLAAKVVSARAIAESLIKIGAYAQYRNRVETACLAANSSSTGNWGCPHR